MRKKITKLTLSLLVLAGSLELMPKAAVAAPSCPPYYCCDAFCTGVRYCHQFAGGACLCEEACRVRELEEID
jgi:hypothetical protein